MKTSLNQVQLRQFETTLIQERSRLTNTESDSVSLDDNRLELKTSAPSNPDERTPAESLPTTIALEEHTLESIAGIDFALKRITSNEYGVCIDCGTQIPTARLLAFPAAARCLPCKTTFEAKA